MLTGVSATTDTGLDLSAAYTYENDRIKTLTTPTSTYTFSYGDFGLRTKVKVGSLTLANYTYESGTNYSKTLEYGNDDGVELY